LVAEKRKRRKEEASVSGTNFCGRSLNLTFTLEAKQEQEYEEDVT